MDDDTYMESSRSASISHFEELDPFEQAIVTLLAISCEPAHSTMLVNCLKRLGFKKTRGNQPTSNNVNHSLVRLQQAGFLNTEGQCDLELGEILCKRAVRQGYFQQYAEVVRLEAPVSYFYGKWKTRCWRALREIRIGIYTQQFDIIDDATDFLGSQCGEILGPVPVTVRVLCSPFDSEWLRSLPPSFQFYLLADVLNHGQATLTCYKDAVNFLVDEKGYSQLGEDEQLPFKRLCFNELLFQGKLERAQEFVTTHKDSFLGTGALGSILFLTGKNKQARQAFADDMRFLQKLSDNTDTAFFGSAGIFWILLRIAAADDDEYQNIARDISTVRTLFGKSRENSCYGYLAEVVGVQIKKSEHLVTLELPEEKEDVINIIFYAYSHYWLNNTIPLELTRRIASLQKRAEQQGYLFAAVLLAEILTIIHGNESEYINNYRQLQSVTGIIPLQQLIIPEEPWKRSLRALISATRKKVPDGIRMGWILTLDGDTISLAAREQKIVQDGSWSKGRPIALSRLYGNDKLSYLSVQDREICAAIRKESNPTNGNAIYRFDLEKALPAMIGHPHLFLADSPPIPVEFIKGEPELLIEERGENLHICFAQPITGEKVTLHKETPTRIKVITVKDQHLEIARITGTEGISVPKAASEEVLNAIGNISSFMTVHSAIAADHRRQKGNIQFVEADSTIYIHLIPYGTGFRLEMFVKPFPAGNHYLKPGQGVENIMAEVDGIRLQTKRNLLEEENRAREVEELCPVLDLAVDLEQENEREWHLYDPDDCLQALMELQGIRDQVRIEWPEGEKLTITQQVSGEKLNLKIRTNRQNWFAMSGQLELDQGKIIELKELLKKVGNSRSRFVKIGDGQFIALTQEFRKRLEDIRLFSQDLTDEEEILIHPLAAIQLEELAEQAKAETDDGWQQMRQRISSTKNFVPTVPSTLRGELRHYQREGFEWLARLAHWGVGGCLADDMGLGKTIQSLAVILELANKGPSLVIAPTSVSTNWQTEVQRFAPTIKLHFLGGREREKTVQSLGKFDLLVTTYTLLQQESKLLSSLQWQAVILDEAQAIKNSATKRSQAAMALRARFKLITTGTPIENHLGELWNLFHFINPGLLGGLSHFNTNFAIPIERHGNREARLRLKKLIRPFLLRRIKSQVLEELPSRTEVTLNVEMSEEERLFYEALRQNAIDILENSREQKGHNLQILTEITRLRQACCNVRLIEAGSPIESSKLKVFAEVISELLGSNHKALVFSQFIGHLSIIREYLDKQKIHYQYLDGNTSAKQRKIRVDAFQAGEGKLFLISLKAGGLGLNLTAADYVLHMDPWWNPAIEDQASDRAYRIGQTRPVTIYRLVCKDTIEEKIVKLHQEKRELAGSLLEGTDSSARISTEELLSLIKTG